MHEADYSEARFRLMLEHISDFVFELDRDGNFLYMSPKWEDYFGINSEEYIGKPFTPCIHPEDVAICMELFQRVVDTGKQGKSGEYRVRAVDGSWRWHQATGAPVLGERGQVISYVGVSRDITELLEARGSLQRALTEKKTLFQEFRHRVKNTFQIIVMMIESQIDQQADQGTDGALQEIRAKVIAFERLFHLLYQSDSSRTVELAEYCQAVTATILASSAGVTYETAFDSVTTPVNFAGTIGLILVELLTNSVKYAFPLGRGGVIRVNLVRKASEIELSVIDGGIGLLEGVEQGGSGMGLIRGMVAQLKGEMTLSGESGTRIAMRFPLP